MVKWSDLSSNEKAALSAKDTPRSTYVGVGGTVSAGTSGTQGVSVSSGQSSSSSGQVYNKSSGQVSSKDSLGTAVKTGVGITYTNDNINIENQYMRQQYEAKTGKSALGMSTRQILSEMGGVTDATMKFTPDYSQLNITKATSSTSRPELVSQPYATGALIYSGAEGRQLLPSEANARLAQAQTTISQAEYKKLDETKTVESPFKSTLIVPSTIKNDLNPIGTRTDLTPNIQPVKQQSVLTEYKPTGLSGVNYEIAKGIGNPDQSASHYVKKVAAVVPYTMTGLAGIGISLLPWNWMKTAEGTLDLATNVVTNPHEAAMSVTEAGIANPSKLVGDVAAMVISGKVIGEVAPKTAGWGISKLSTSKKSTFVAPENIISKDVLEAWSSNKVQFVTKSSEGVKTYSPTQSMKAFNEPSKFKEAIGEKGPGGFTATGESFAAGEIKQIASRPSDVSGQYIAPSTSVPFLRIGAASGESTTFTLLPKIPQPTIVYTRTGTVGALDIRKIGFEKQKALFESGELKGQTLLTPAHQLGKGEVEAVIAKGTVTKDIGSTYYTQLPVKLFGKTTPFKYDIPIAKYEVVNAVNVKGISGKISKSLPTTELSSLYKTKGGSAISYAASSSVVSTSKLSSTTPYKSAMSSPFKTSTTSFYKSISSTPISKSIISSSYSPISKSTSYTPPSKSIISSSYSPISKSTSYTPPSKSIISTPYTPSYTSPSKSPSYTSPSKSLISTPYTPSYFGKPGTSYQDFGGKKGERSGKLGLKYTASLRGLVKNIKQKGAAKKYLSGSRSGQELRAINI